jgi:hypothetical protein
MTIEGWLETKAQITVELERLLTHPELLVFEDALGRLTRLAEDARGALRPRVPVREPARVEASPVEVLAAKREPSPRNPHDVVHEEATPLVNAPPTRGHGIRDATFVLTGLASRIHDEMRAIDDRGAPSRERVDALTSWVGAGDELALMDDAPRGDLLHAIVAFTRMSQGELGCDARCQERISGLFQRVLHHPGLRARRGGEALFIHGMARKATPAHGASWRDDWEHWWAEFESHVTPPPTGEQARPTRAQRRTPDAPDQTLEDVLSELVQTYPGRVVVLDSAVESARQASDFRNVTRASELLHRLATDYLDAYLDSGDTVAREIFTRDEYASTESETTRKNARAIKLRTFIYEGARVVCLKHLRIGNGSDTRSGWRCYFAVEGDVIVIGHCGAHLDVR